MILNGALRQTAHGTKIPHFGLHPGKSGGDPPSRLRHHHTLAPLSSPGNQPQPIWSSSLPPEHGSVETTAKLPDRDYLAATPRQLTRPDCPFNLVPRGTCRYPAVSARASPRYLRGVCPTHRIGLIHSKMKPSINMDEHRCQSVDPSIRRRNRGTPCAKTFYQQDILFSIRGLPYSLATLTTGRSC